MTIIFRTTTTLLSESQILVPVYPQISSDKLFKTKVSSKTGTKNESGTGMGMMFCKDLVEKCSGKIWVHSEQGQGTENFL